jgi:hypothetical protein
VELTSDLYLSPWKYLAISRTSPGIHLSRIVCDSAAFLVSIESLSAFPPEGSFPRE